MGSWRFDLHVGEWYATLQWQKPRRCDLDTWHSGIVAGGATDLFLLRI